VIGGTLGAFGAGAGALPGAGLGAAFGAFGGGLYEGGKWLLGTDAKEGIQKGSEVGTEKGAEKGSESGTEKGAEKGILGGMLQLLQKMNFQGNGANGGGLINAAYTTTDGGVISGGGLHSGGGWTIGTGGSRGYLGSFSGGTSIPGTPGTGDPRGMLSVIREAAIRNGINPDLMERVARSEGLTARYFGGDRGTSFGAMQLHRGGAGSVGTEYERLTGHSLSDPRNEAEEITFAAKWIQKYGWGAWMGARKHGIVGRMGVHAPPMSSVPGTTHFSTGDVMDAVTGGDLVPPPASSRQIELHHTSMLDGRVLTKTVTKHLVAMGNRPGLGGRMPDYSATRPLSV
jgi:hypothetical protein